MYEQNEAKLYFIYVYVLSPRVLTVVPKGLMKKWKETLRNCVEKNSRPVRGLETFLKIKKWLGFQQVIDLWGIDSQARLAGLCKWESGFDIFALFLTPAAHAARKVDVK